MPSAISAARIGLHAALKAYPPLFSVQVTYGPPVSYEEQEVVALLGVSDADEEDAAVGAGRREETFRLDVRIKKHDPAGTAESVDKRAFALHDHVRAAVHGDRTLGGAVRTAEIASLSSDGPVPAEGGGWVEFLTVQVACAQRITGV